MLDRRTLLKVAAAGVATPGLSAVPEGTPPAPIPPPAITRLLARYALETRLDATPPAVQHEGVRTLLNWVGCAVGGSRHESIPRLISAVQPFAGPAQAQLLGRPERIDALHAALVNGVSSHVFDYDDTHLKTIIHPAAPVVPAALALAELHPVRGSDFLNAVLIGIEIECRIGNAVYPSHYEMGWHITGSCGPFGSAATCGRLLGLDETQMLHALSLAASQPVGLKVQFGTMAKSFHPGRAAQNGLLAALLAQQGFTSDEAAIEGRDGWVQALSQHHDWLPISDGLGVRFESALNTYKPFACGVVAHPAIDAAIQLRLEAGLKAPDIRDIELRANPLVLTLTGKTDPRTGLEGKFSIYHCIAAGIVAGAAGERQFSDSFVNEPTLIALRHRIHVSVDASIAPERCELTIRTVDGRVLIRRIEHALGSLERPLSEPALDAKFLDLCDGVLTAENAKHVLQLCRDVGDLPDAGAIARAAAPLNT